MFVQEETKALGGMGAIVKAARQNKRLTQEDLASDVGITLRYLQGIENEKKYPAIGIVYRLIHSLDISADQIFRPESMNRSIEDDLLIHSILSCSRDERDIITETVLTLMQELKEKRPSNE